MLSQSESWNNSSKPSSPILTSWAQVTVRSGVWRVCHGAPSAWTCEGLVWKGTGSPSFRRRTVTTTFEGWNEGEGKLVYNVVEPLLFLYPWSIFIKLKEFCDFLFLRHCASLGWVQTWSRIKIGSQKQYTIEKGEGKSRSEVLFCFYYIPRNSSK